MPSTGSGQRWACRSEAVATTRTESAPRRARQTSRSRCFRSLGASWVGALIAALRTWRSGLRARGRSARLGASDYDDVPGDRLLLAGASSHTPPCSINSFIGILHEFIWRAQNWGAVSLCATDVFHSSTQCGVRNMSDIPRQQELHSVKPTCAASAAACGGNGTRSMNVAASSATSVVTSKSGRPSMNASRRRAASGFPAPASSSTTCEITSSNAGRCTSHQMCVNCWRPATTRSRLGRFAS